MAELYLILLAIGIAFCYVFIPYFFGAILAEAPRFREAEPRRFGITLPALLAFTLLTFYLSLQIPDPETANRFLHAIGGGFNVVLAGYFGLKDFGVKIRRSQYAILMLLTVSFLGVTNEISEFFLQEFFGVPLAFTPADTWLDLISNIVGTSLGILATLVFSFRKE